MCLSLGCRFPCLWWTHAQSALLIWWAAGSTTSKSTNLVLAPGKPTVARPSPWSLRTRAAALTLPSLMMEFTGASWVQTKIWLHIHLIIAGPRRVLKNLPAPSNSSTSLQATTTPLVTASTSSTPPSVSTASQCTSTLPRAVSSGILAAIGWSQGLSGWMAYYRAKVASAGSMAIRARMFWLAGAAMTCSQTARSPRRKCGHRSIGEPWLYDHSFAVDCFLCLDFIPEEFSQ